MIYCESICGDKINVWTDVGKLFELIVIGGAPAPNES